MRRATVLACLLFTPSLPAAEPSPADLVRHLGDPRFATRRQAEASLIALGPATVDALEAGLASGNPEVRSRCARLLPLARRSPLECRLARFLADLDPREPAVPGWERFRARFGDTAAGRDLFALMSLAQPDLLARLDADPATVAEVLPGLASRLSRFDFPDESPAHGLALLFVAAETDARLGPAGASVPGLLIRSGPAGLLRSNPAARQVLAAAVARPQASATECKQAISTARNLGLYEFAAESLYPAARKRVLAACDRPAGPAELADALTLSQMAAKDLVDTRIRQAARDTFAAWEPDPQAPTEVAEALSLGRTLNVREAAPAALKVARDGRFNGFVRGQALCLLGRIGRPEQAAGIEALLGDTSPVGSASVKALTVRAEVRDVALAALAELSGRDPGTLGFPYLKALGPVAYELPPNCYGFTGDDEREAALRAWRDTKASAGR